MSKMNRRELGKGISAGLAAAVLPSAKLHAEEGLGCAPSAWEVIYPGVWKATIGVPEEHTPVADRVIGPVANELGRLPTISTPA